MGGRLPVAIRTALLLFWGATSAQAINIHIDTTYDSNGFFAVGSPARLALETVTDFYSDILDDTFSPISTPAPYTSSLPPSENPGTAQWLWTMSFTNPSAANQVTITNPSVAADEYRLFVGAKNLSGNTLGQGGPGGGSRQSFSDGGFFTFEEIDEINSITSAFNLSIDKRGEASGFARWGGVASFDFDTPSWHFDPNTLPPAGKNDFFTIAMHEIGHALGLGSSSDWTALTAGSGDAAYFFGESAVAEYGGTVPLAFNIIGSNPVADKAHWREAVTSNVFGSSAAQEVLMAPSITVGTRKRLTALDAAALTDIGWTVLPPPNLPGDFNHDDVVDAADYTVWRNGLGPTYLPGDYQIWKSHFGQRRVHGAGALSQFAVVPETIGGLPLFLAVGLLFGRFILSSDPHR